VDPKTPRFHPERHKSLITKLAEACKAAGPISKQGKNATADYSWLRACDVMTEFRDKVLGAGIIILPEELELNEEIVELNGGQSVWRTRVKIRFDIIDGKTKEIESRTAFGTALDAGDKGLMKASTAAFKKFLKVVGMIADPADDPEADERTDQATAGRRETDQGAQWVSGGESNMDRKRPTRAASKLTKITGAQIDQFVNACQQSGNDADAIRQILAKFSVKTIAELTAANFKNAMKFANSILVSPRRAPTPAEKQPPNGHAQPIAALLDKVPQDEVSGV
jgi:hypothetical protein